MNILFLSILLVIFNHDHPKSDLTGIWESDNFKKHELYSTKLTAPFDTCDGNAILEAMLDQVYDSMVFKWYYEGDIINEAASAIQVEKPGRYTVEISGILNGNVQLTQQTFVVPEVISIEAINITPASCNEKNGSLLIDANYDSGIQYSIDGENFQSENTFRDLAAGNYTVTIKDDFSCMDDQQILLDSISSPVIQKIEASPSICGDHNGRILYEVSGGSGQISALLNSETLPINNSFQLLAPGEYLLTFTDEAACTITSTISVPGVKCPIYVPNVFSPNGDGNNDLFKIEAKTGSNSKINTYLIFDRWGKQVYKANNFLISSSDQWWDGTINNKKAGSGAYLYLIEVEFDNNETETLQGEIYIIH